ncbi:MAG: MFS transporter [Chloroflexota bacterium]|nr:MFS transporter [Chloroflexota bacterium]
MSDIDKVRSSIESEAGTVEYAVGYRWVILALMFFLQASASMAIFSFGPLAPFLQESLGITRAQVGMFSSAIYMGMLLFGTHAGWLTDKFGIRLFLIAGPGIAALFFLSLALTRSFIPALLIVFISGIGYQFITPASVKTITQWFPPTMRGTAIGIRQAGVSFGGAIGAVILPIIALSWGWRGGVISIGVIILAVVILCRVFYRENHAESELSRSTLVTLKDLGQIVTNRNILLQSAVGVMYCAPSVALSTYLVLYLKETLLVTIVMAGTCLMVFQLGSVGGRVLWGVVSDRIFKGKRKGTMIIMGILIAVMSVITMFIFPSIPRWLIYVIFAVFGFSVGIHGVHATFLAELSGRKMAATGVGFGTATAALGMVIATPIFGYIVDKTDSYRIAWLFLAILGILGAILASLVHEETD